MLLGSGLSALRAERGELCLASALVVSEPGGLYRGRTELCSVAEAPVGTSQLLVTGCPWEGMPEATGEVAWPSRKADYSLVPISVP